jgi:hypothetical protein
MGENPLAEEWTYRFLAAAHAWAETEHASLTQLTLLAVDDTATPTIPSVTAGTWPSSSATGSNHPPPHHGGPDPFIATHPGTAVLNGRIV